MYNTLVRAGIYTTEAEGKIQYEMEANKVSFDYVAVLYSSIKDSEVKVTDDEIVDLARPGKENFFSKKPDNFTIIVNGRDKSWSKRTITFEEVVALAEGNSNDGNKAYFN